MSALYVERAGLVTSVGLGLDAACAAFRCKLALPTESRLLSIRDEWVKVHRVVLAPEGRGLPKLARMAALAIGESLEALPDSVIGGIPLLLCVAEPERPGRIDGLDSHLFDAVTGLLGMRFAKGSGVIAAGRAGLGRALQQARSLMAQGRVSRVLVAAADSLLDWPTLQSLAEEGRLLGAGNSNGFMPGEAGAALLLGSAGSQPALQLRGLGFGTEPSPLASTTPLRCDGLATAISSALGEAGLAFQDLDLRMADLSGEHYYFKEAALAVSRILRAHKEELDLWHPAECTGETGAAAPLCMMAYADVACRRGYSPGPRVLLHFGNDAGQRVAAVLQYGVAA